MNLTKKTTKQSEAGNYIASKFIDEASQNMDREEDSEDEDLAMKLEVLKIKNVTADPAVFRKQCTSSILNCLVKKTPN